MGPGTVCARSGARLFPAHIQGVNIGKAREDTKIAPVLQGPEDLGCAAIDGRLSPAKPERGQMAWRCNDG